MSWGAVIGAVAAPVVGGLLGGSSGGNQPAGSTSTTTQNQIDPRFAEILYGKDGKGGLLSQIQGYAGQGQSPGLGAASQAANNYTGTFNAVDLEKIRNAGLGLMGGNQAPQTQAAYSAGPAQNQLDLTGSFNSLINGTPGANPYLTGAIGKGINQANTAIQNWQTDATKNLTEGILPGLRSGAQVNGTYGSDRQGIAEGNAVRDFATQQQRAISQTGQNAQDTAAAQQAAAYDADRNRQLAATTGLSGQQYGLAGQNLANQQQSNLANQSAQLQTNNQNQQGAVAGSGLLAGNLGTTYNQVLNSDQYGLNNLGKVSGLLQPYGNLGMTQTQNQPYFNNQAGNILGGATAGLGLYNGFKNSFGGSGSGGNITSPYDSIFTDGGF